jgi:hypothetical protein
MKHFEGGTLRMVMAKEVKRVLKKNRHNPRPVIAASLELGVHHKTLRVWMGPVDKGGWAELQPTSADMIDLMGEIFG